MARVCTLKDWLKAFSRKQEEDLHFFVGLLTSGKVSKEISREVSRRLQERQEFGRFFKTLSWHNLSLEELQWCEKKMEEIISREDTIKDILDKILKKFEQFPIKPLQ